MLEVIKYQEKWQLAERFYYNTSVVHKSHMDLILSNKQIYLGDMRLTDAIDYNLDLKWVCALYAAHTFQNLATVDLALVKMHENLNSFVQMHHLYRGQFDLYFAAQVDLYYYFKIITLMRQVRQCYQRELAQILRYNMYSASVRFPIQVGVYPETNLRLYHLLTSLNIIKKIKKKYGFSGCIEYNQHNIMLHTLKHGYIFLATTIGKKTGYNPKMAQLNLDRSKLSFPSSVIFDLVTLLPEAVSCKVKSLLKTLHVL